MKTYLQNQANQMMHKVVKWIAFKDASEYPESCGGMGGWFKEGDTWDTYVERQTEVELPYLEAIRDNVLASGSFLNGYNHQYSSDGIPLFDDGTVGTFTFRAWGDLMAAIATIKDGPTHHYMDYYM